MQHWQRIPKQICGSSSDAAKQLDVQDIEWAERLYAVACARLLDVNNWGKFSSIALSTFQLFDQQAKAVDRAARKDDFIRINIPGPGLHIGKGYDWVTIEAIWEDELPDGEMLTMRVRPSSCPLTNNIRVAHFLLPIATSTFQIKRINTRLYAEEHARNEKANVLTGNYLDNIRNAFVGIAAQIGFSYPQWKSLVNGLLVEKP